MTYVAYAVSKTTKNKVMGMAGILDTARYRAFLAEALDVSPRDIQALLMGGHGDTMVPLPRYTTVAGIPVTELIDKETIDKIIDRTKKGRWRIGKPDGYFGLVCTQDQLLHRWLKQLLWIRNVFSHVALNWRVNSA